MSASKIAAVSPDSYSDRTDRRIRAYLASVELRDGSADDLAGYYRGLVTIEALARSANDEDPPSRRLLLREAADVLTFVRNSTPVSETDWWADRDDRPSPVCGMVFVMDAARDSISFAMAAMCGPAPEGAQS
jgi:hypothetical protein